MNERILELARVAEQLADDELAHLERVHNRLYSFTEGREIYNKKFAELIVRECLAKAEEEAELYRGFSHLGGAEYAKVMYNYQLLLKEHFGVEE
jgi:predicted ABC-class ATPase